jgi:hypothetical protein
MEERRKKAEMEGRNQSAAPRNDSVGLPFTIGDF